MKKQTNDRYAITSAVKGLTSRGANYFNITAVDIESGEVVYCTYFGNTTPKRLLKIIEHQTKESVYHLAVIQPHTPRDKKTGRFISTKRKNII